MSLDLTFVDILALGESDEEDPVFEIGKKKRSKHKKMQKSETKVGSYSSFSHSNQTDLTTNSNSKNKLTNFLLQMPEENKKLVDNTGAPATTKKRRRTRNRKNKGFYPATGMHSGQIIDILHLLMIKFLKFLRKFSSEIIAVTENNEEIKFPPNATADEGFFHPVEHVPVIVYADAEESKAADAFIARYKECKLAQDYENQAVIEDIEPERYFGNTEYKLKLTHTSPERIIRLTTQMKFRLQEGNGEAFYVIGAGDNGEALGINAEEMEISLRILHKMATELNAELFVRSVSKGRIGEIVKVMVV